LEQELRIYRSVPASDESLRAFANDSAPKLQQLLEDARRARQAIGP
jgi:hypothetical protein